MKRQLGIALLAISLFVAASLALQRESPATKAALEASLQAQFSGVTGALTPSQTWDKTATAIHAGVIVGATGPTAAVGEIGEQVRSFLPRSSATSLSNNAAKTVTSITLTPGHWELSFGGGATPPAAGTYFLVGISTTNNVMPGSDQYADNAFAVLFNLPNDTIVGLAGYSVTPAISTTYYLVAQAGFTSGACSAYGRLSARRVR